MVRIDRVTGDRVFGVFPTEVERRSSVIWEAFKPETEPRRTFRREEPEEEEPVLAPVRQAVVRPERPVVEEPDEAEFLQRQGGIY